MNMMRTTRTDNLRAVNRMDSIKRRKANEPAQQTVIHKELPQKPSRVEIHTIEPTTTTKRSLPHSDRLLETAESNYLSENWDRIQEERAPVVTIGDQVQQTVTKTAETPTESPAKKATNVEPMPKRYQAAVALYEAAYQSNEVLAKLSILA